MILQYNSRTEKSSLKQDLPCIFGEHPMVNLNWESNLRDRQYYYNGAVIMLRGISQGLNVQVKYIIW